MGLGTVVFVIFVTFNELYSLLTRNSMPTIRASAVFYANYILNKLKFCKMRKYHIKFIHNSRKGIILS